MIIVIGAGGFIGAYLVDELVENGFKVLAVDRSKLAESYFSAKQVPFLRMDITEEDAFRLLPEGDVTAVINVACLQPHNVSEAAYRPSDYIRVNVIGNLNILEYCRRVGAKRFVYTISHRGVQGLWDKGEVVTEASVKALKYTGDYAMFSISEAAAQDCVEHYAQRHGLETVVLRLPPVYGYGPHLEGYRDGKAVKSGFLVFIENARAGRPLELWGDYERARDIVYVKDVVSAILLTLRTREARGLYNIASGERLSLKQEAEAIYAVFGDGRSPEFRYRGDRPNSVEPFLYDIGKARRELQYFPRYKLREMLKDIKDEMERGRFEYLIGRRKMMLAGGDGKGDL